MQRSFLASVTGLFLVRGDYERTDDEHLIFVHLPKLKMAIVTAVVILVDPMVLVMHPQELGRPIPLCD